MVFKILILGLMAQKWYLFGKIKNTVYIEKKN